MNNLPKPKSPDPFVSVEVSSTKSSTSNRSEISGAYSPELAFSPFTHGYYSPSPNPSYRSRSRMSSGSNASSSTTPRKLSLAAGDESTTYQYYTKSHSLSSHTPTSRAFGDVSRSGRFSIDGKIHEFRDEQERVQKKTFVNWMNSYLSKRTPPLKVDNLLDDLKDGSKLVHLLEVLSGEKLPVEKGRILRRPHFLSNCNTALEFLRSKKIKLVNINASDVVDGRPSVVLGLIWTIILYFQIEENYRALELLNKNGDPMSHVHGSQTHNGVCASNGFAEGSDKTGASAKTKWKVGAKEALLAWCRNNSKMQVQNFGKSWRDGRVFLGIINSVVPTIYVDTDSSSSNKTNKERLQYAFDTAEKELGIAKLLDPEDVDVENPDEKSIMTYVAQFLHKYADNISEKTLDSSVSFELQFKELETWLSERIKFFEDEHLSKGKALKDYARYQTFKKEKSSKQDSYDTLCAKLKMSSQTMVGKEAALTSIETKWQKIEAQVRHWQWLLDTALPGELGQVGEWVNQGEALVYSEDVPTELNEEAAAVLSQKN